MLIWRVILWTSSCTWGSLSRTLENVKLLVGVAAQRMDCTGTRKGDHDGNGAQSTARKLSLDDELLLTLIKLQHNFPESDLSNRFAISWSTVSRIFATWVLCLYSTFKKISIWLSQRLIDLHVPSGFEEKYPSICLIIDATKFKIE